MDFVDQVKQFSRRVETMKDGLETEEATKMSLIVPFFSMLGYDVFNPSEFVPEFTADVGIKKGEKVDYAIVKDNQPIILIEAKWCGEKLEKHDSQLFRYFGTTMAKFAVLTNGVVYRFYTDLEEPNKMDKTPFLEIDMLNLKDAQIAELKKFQKSNFNIDEIFSTASDLKYSTEFKNILARELQDPSDNFTKLFLNETYSGRQTQNVVDKFKPVLKKALNIYINELMNDKIKSALNSESSNDKSNEEEPVDAEAVDEDKAGAEKKIVTTPEELEAFFIVKNILKQVLPIEDITYKDTVSYFGVLYKDNRNKWICRFVLTDNRKFLILPTADKGKEKIQINEIYDIYNYEQQILEIAKTIAI